MLICGVGSNKIQTDLKSKVSSFFLNEDHEFNCNALLHCMRNDEFDRVKKYKIVNIESYFLFKTTPVNSKVDSLWLVRIF